MPRLMVWHLPGSPSASLLADLPGDFEARPLPMGALVGTGHQDGVVVVDLDAGDAVDEAAAAARRTGLPIVALLGPGVTDPPPLDCHTYLTKPVARFALVTALVNACEHVRLRREHEATRQQL